MYADSHDPDAQSEPTRQARPSTHASQVPPQSTSVSYPSYMSFEHETQRPHAQRECSQSASMVHAALSAQNRPIDLHESPPQSISVSHPFNVPSLQAWRRSSTMHTPSAPQLPEMQSENVRQVSPIWQGREYSAPPCPPPSMHVSSASWMPLYADAHTPLPPESVLLT